MAAPLRSMLTLMQPSSQEAMIGAFLEAGLGSPRFSDDLLRVLQAQGTDRSLIDNADLSDPTQNAEREASRRDLSAPSNGIAGRTGSKTAP